MDTELEYLEKQLRLLEESLWYIKWSPVFTISAVITEVIVLVDLYRHNFIGVMETWGISLVLLGISFYLRSKSRECFRRAHGDE